ncbi:MDR family MFS transporter [Metabacillus sp. RGM 3146]|uniref:MDR family MFS transporter n=1 Tax=Metabacillus sp. RGM 3146 TaxID=3401092 RepID=UPI003B9CC2FF
MENTHVQSREEVKVVPIVAVLISGAFIAILNQTLLATALPHIMKDLSLSSNTVQWLQTIFLLVNGIMIPVTAFLTAKFTTRSLYLSAIGLFGIGTFICSIAPGFSLLIIGRIIQGAGAGIIIPLIQTVLFVIFPIEKRGQAMGIFGLVIAFAPAIGPTLSGWLVDQYSWRTLFDVVLPIAILDFFIAFFVLKNVTKQTYPKLDIASIFLSTLGFGGLLFGFSSAGNIGWGSPLVIASIIVGALALIIFISRQFKLKEPILEFKVFQYPIFTLTTAIAAIVFVVMISSATILPIFMQNMLNYSALKSGLMLLPGAIVMGMLSPISGRLYDKVGAKKLAVPGLIITTITTFLFCNLSTSTSFLYLSIINAIRLFGVGLVMMPVTTAGLNQLPKLLISHGTAMNNTMRQIAGSIGTAILFTVIATAQNPKDKDAEGIIHGVNVSFAVTGFICALGIIFAFMMKEKRPNESE